MKKTLLLSLLLITSVAFAQIDEKDPKDLWTKSIDVTLGDNWQQKSIPVPGKGTPNVVDFFRAFAKAYPCEYHNLLAMALDGDEEVKFNHHKPYIEIDKDSTLMQNQSFSMKVFYDGDKPAALGVCCLKAITTELQEAYYYRYNAKTRQLKPFAKGSDFTGGIVKRGTTFFPEKQWNEASMTHTWGRCGIASRLEWNKGKFLYQDPTKQDLKLYGNDERVMHLMRAFVSRYDMELREPEHDVDPNLEGGSYLSLPVCIAIYDERSGGNCVTAMAMEGTYYFYARGWEKPDGSLLVAVYTECAPDLDFGRDEEGQFTHTPHKLTAGDEVSLKFYLCQPELASYLDPASPTFATTVGKGLPDLDRNEWRCKLGFDNEELVFVSEADGHQKVFKWNGNKLIEQ